MVGLCLIVDDCRGRVNSKVTHLLRVITHGRCRLFKRTHKTCGEKTYEVPSKKTGTDRGSVVVSLLNGRALHHRRVC